MKAFLLMGNKSEEPFPEPNPSYPPFINQYFLPHTIHRGMFLRRTGTMKVHARVRETWEWVFNPVCPDCGYPLFCGCTACAPKIPKGYKPYTHRNPPDDDLRVCANCGMAGSEDYWFDVEAKQHEFSKLFHDNMRGKAYAIPPIGGEPYIKVILAHPEGKVHIPRDA